MNSYLNRQSSVIFLFITSIFVAMPAFAEKTTINFGMAVWKPFSYKEGDELKGNAINAANKFADELNLDLKIKVLPFKRLMADLGAKKIDCAVLPKGILPVTTSARPALKDVLKIYYKKSREGELGTLPSSVQELLGKKVLLIRGATYNNLSQPLLADNNKAYINEVGTHLASVKMLKLGRGDFLLNYYVPFAAAVKESGGSLEEYGSIDILNLDGYVVCTNPAISQETADQIADGSYKYMREELMPYGVVMPAR